MASKLHKEMYPEQYAHALCGETVYVRDSKPQITGVVERVVSSRFGQLAHLKQSDPKTFYGVNQLVVLDVTSAAAE